MCCVYIHVCVNKSFLQWFIPLWYLNKFPTLARKEKKSLFLGFFLGFFFIPLKRVNRPECDAIEGAGLQSDRMLNCRPPGDWSLPFYSFVFGSFRYMSFTRRSPVSFNTLAKCINAMHLIKWLLLPCRIQTCASTINEEAFDSHTKQFYTMKPQNTKYF